MLRVPNFQSQNQERTMLLVCQVFLVNFSKWSCASLSFHRTSANISSRLLLGVVITFICSLLISRNWLFSVVNWGQTGISSGKGTGEFGFL